MHLMQLTILTISTTLACALSMAEVKANCSGKFSGEVSCEFQNNGTTKGGVCVVMQMARENSANMYSYPNYGGKGTVLSTEEICSGLVEPGDIRERKPVVTWSANGAPMTPLHFCQSDNRFMTASQNCSLNTIVVENKK